MPKTEDIVLGGGCFWCLEAVFQLFRGIIKITPGYAGGTVENPTYYQVCSGTTGHAEVIEIKFDPSIVALPEILTIFFYSHNPTTVNRQGHDVGSEYRSIILYNGDQQREFAQKVIEEIAAAKVWGDEKIVTELRKKTSFTPAEIEHHNYYLSNPEQGYCSFVIAPKVKKARELFAHLLK